MSASIRIRKVVFVAAAHAWKDCYYQTGVGNQIYCFSMFNLTVYMVHSKCTCGMVTCPEAQHSKSAVVLYQMQIRVANICVEVGKISVMVPLE